LKQRLDQDDEALKAETAEMKTQQSAYDKLAKEYDVRISPPLFP
jgi:hypothetical protein